MAGMSMQRQLMVAGLAGLLLSACGPKAGEQRAEGQKNEPVNIAQDVAGAATGVATGATGALNTEAFVRDAAIGGALRDRVQQAGPQAIHELGHQVGRSNDH